MHIVVDMRENGRYEKLLREKGAAVERRTLSVGDFILSGRLAVERKSRTDFEASILDGRLFEQAKRLSGAYERAVMVVEGSSEDGGRVGKAALLGAYSSLMADFGLSLFFTRSPEGTAELLVAMARHEQIAGRAMRVMAKPKSLTMGDYQKAVIEVLPGCGPLVAERLLSYFGSPINVMTADEKKLQEVDKVGPKKAKMIRRVLDSVYECKREGKDPDD